MKVLAVIIGLVCAALVVPAGPASADSGFVDGPPDKGLHTWCYMSGFNETVAADAAMTNLRNQTDVDPAYYQTCRSDTDVWWRSARIDDAYGMAVCQAWNASNQCERYQVTLNSALINSSPQPSAQRTKTSCHELGHTAGVSHYSGSQRPGGDSSDSCMKSGTVTTTTQPWHRKYGPHHINSHINTWF